MAKEINLLLIFFLFCSVFAICKHHIGPVFLNDERELWKLKPSMAQYWFYTEDPTIVDSLFDIFSRKHQSHWTLVENKPVNIHLLGFLDLSP